jgi:choline dehydrogenase-like flavoprotein
MISDPSMTNPDAADVIVVGAGAVGLTMAVDMAQSGLRVVVTEAGPRTVTRESQKFFESATYQGYPLEGLHLGRFRALGGTTNFWGGQLVPMPANIYGHRPWVSDARWPVSQDELVPYFDRVFDLIGLKRRIDADADVWDRLGVVPPPSTPELDLFFTRWTPEPNFARFFNAQIAKNENLKIAVDAPVTALVVSEGRVNGVEIAMPGGGRRLIKAPYVVLANGTVEIARLLQLPLSDGREAPWAANPWLGRGFADHIDCYAGQVTPIDKKRFHDLFDNAYLDGLKYSPKLRLKEDAQAQGRLFSIAAHFIFNSSVAEHAKYAKIFLASLMRGKFDRSIFSNIGELAKTARIAAPMIHRYLRSRRMYNLADKGIQLRLTSEQKPLASNIIRLRPDRDELGLPRVDVTWGVDGVEMETLTFFATRIRNYLQAHDLAKVEINPLLEACDPDFLKQIDDANHHMGGARMAASPQDGVVDEDLKVFGTPNLFVAGAAVFPATGFPNPTLTAMALGLRLSEKLCKESR